VTTGGQDHPPSHLSCPVLLFVVRSYLPPSVYRRLRSLAFEADGIHNTQIVMCLLRFDLSVRGGGALIRYEG
jgi:hypothetical protein